VRVCVCVYVFVYVVVVVVVVVVDNSLCALELLLGAVEICACRRRLSMDFKNTTLSRVPQGKEV